MTPAALYSLYKSDYLHEDATEVISIAPRAGGTAVTGTGKQTEVTPNTLRMLGQEFGTPTDDMRGFFVWIESLSDTGYELDQGDIITRDDASRWTVEASAKVRFDTQWLLIIKGAK